MDAQGDFTQPGGKLYVLGAEKIILNLLHQLGKDHEVILYGVFTAESKPRLPGMQSQQLLTEGEVLEDEFLSTLNGGDGPAEKVSKAHKHQRILANSGRRKARCPVIGSANVRNSDEPYPKIRRPPDNQFPTADSLLPLVRNAGFF